MEWITAVLGALVAVLAMQVIHWRTVAGLGARVRSLELAVADLQEDEPGDESYGKQCVDLYDEYRNLLIEAPPAMDTHLPVVRHLTVPALLSLLPRKGIRIQPALDGMGMKVVASYFCVERYRTEIGQDLELDMRELVKNTGPEWELSTVHNEALMQYEFRIQNLGNH
jgi:hypothetical protein